MNSWKLQVHNDYNLKTIYLGTKKYTCLLYSNYILLYFHFNEYTIILTKYLK